jgi:hypothetical protein
MKSTGSIPFKPELTTKKNLDAIYFTVGRFEFTVGRRTKRLKRLWDLRDERNKSLIL